VAGKSWHLDRRTFLLGTGASLGLPFLECMARGEAAETDRPRRFCAMYFGFGVGLPKEGSEQAEWSWFPNGEGRDYTFNKSLEPLEPHRNDLTILGGLSHPNGRKMGGHDTGDTFLTGALLTSKFLRNTVSADQVIAERIGGRTRFPSLVLSTDGGVGEPTRSSTLSYDSKGRPLPALNEPQRVFDRLFGAGDDDVIAKRRRLASASSMLDRVLEDSRDLKRRLGTVDREKLDEYLSSVREIEQRVEQSQRWLEVPAPVLRDEDRALLHLDADDEAPQRYIETMYDLIYLALRTDSTRVATYQVTNMADASSRAGKFPQLEGFKGSLHTLAHGWNKPEGAENLGRWDRFMAERLARFLDRLAAAREPHGSLLDNTVVLYGSSNSQTHNNTNYPLVLAGGRELGLRHGSYHRFGEDVPMSNLLLTMLHAVGVETDHFADGNGHLPEIVA
jgi:hypothetical protein